MRTFGSVDEMCSAVGETLGPGPAVLVDQRRIQAFAEATDDYQWIHLDVERATAGPFGGPVAHGFLTLSLLPVLVGQLYQVDNVGMRVNYGLNRVRFPAPLRAGSYVRATAVISSAEPAVGYCQFVMTVAIKAEGAEKPCCLAESVSRFYAGVAAG